MDAVATKKAYVVNVCEAHPGDFCWSNYVSLEDLVELRSQAASSEYCQSDPCFAALDNVDSLIEAIKTRG
jgi:hypothetical protein